MDKFEMLLNELTSKELTSKDLTSAKLTSSKKLSPKDTGEAKTGEVSSGKAKYNSLGSRVGEQREVVIRYAVGREEQAKVYEGTPGKDGAKEDSFALLYAAGRLIGDATGLDGKEIGNDLVKAATKSMVGNVLSTLMKDLEDLLNG